MLSVGACTEGGDSSAGSCRPPRPVVSPAVVSPGETLEVTIEYPLTCQDGNGPVQPPDTGWRGVRVMLIQGDKETLLATVDANVTGKVQITVPLPSGVTSGPAIVRANSTEEAPLTVK